MSTETQKAVSWFNEELQTFQRMVLFIKHMPNEPDYRKLKDDEMLLIYLAEHPQPAEQEHTFSVEEAVEHLRNGGAIDGDIENRELLNGLLGAAFPNDHSVIGSPRKFYEASYYDAEYWDSSSATSKPTIKLSQIVFNSIEPKMNDCPHCNTETKHSDVVCKNCDRINYTLTKQWQEVVSANQTSTPFECGRGIGEEPCEKQCDNCADFQTSTPKESESINSNYFRSQMLKAFQHGRAFFSIENGADMDVDCPDDNMPFAEWFAKHYPNQ